MQFTKMHGVGNDYIYINGFAETVDDPASLAQRVSDRHFGVGGDGLILVLPPTDDAKAQGAAVRMRMFNADGSESEMCGNGVRCVCKLAYDHNVTPGVRDHNPMKIETGRGVLSLEYQLDAGGKVSRVTVDMGEPILPLADIPVDENKLDDETRRATHVSMGNPHAVFFVDDKTPIEQPDAGRRLERHPAYPRRMNVHFVHVNAPDDVTVYHWERGSGPTLACGIGACAVCVAGVLANRTARQITAHLPGGDLTLHWREADGHVLMTGPATQVFTGDFPLEPSH